MSAVARGALRALALAEAGFGAAGVAAGAAGAARAGGWGGNGGGAPALWFPVAVVAGGAGLMANGLLGCVCGTKSQQCWFEPFAFFSLVALFGEGLLWALFAAAPEALDRMASRDATGLLADVLAWGESHRVGTQALLGLLAGVLGTAFLLSWTVRTCCADLEDYDSDLEEGEGGRGEAAALRRGLAGRYRFRSVGSERGYTLVGNHDQPPLTPEFPPRQMRFFKSPQRSPLRGTIVPQSYDLAGGPQRSPASLASPSLTHPLVEPVPPSTVSPLRPPPSFFKSAREVPRAPGAMQGMLP